MALSPLPDPPSGEAVDRFKAKRQASWLLGRRLGEFLERVRLDDEGNITHQCCSGCHEFKASGDFQRASTATTGRRSACKRCVSEAAALRYARSPEKGRSACRAWREANREKNRARVKKWKGGNKGKTREQMKTWRSRNREKVREDSRRWQRDNPQRHRDGNKKSRLKNPETHLACSARRRALKRNAAGNHTAADRVLVYAIFGKRCLCCGGTHDIVLDHVSPLSPNGSNGPENLQPLCRSCNSSKGNRASTDYRPRAGMEKLLRSI